MFQLDRVTFVLSIKLHRWFRDVSIIYNLGKYSDNKKVLIISKNVLELSVYTLFAPTNAAKYSGNNTKRIRCAKLEL